MSRSVIGRIFALTTLLGCVQAHKILMPVADITSHVLYFGRLAELLRMRGHAITFVLPSNVKVPDDVKKLDVDIITYNTPHPPLMHRDEYKVIAHEMAFNPSISAQMKIVDLGLNVNKATAGFLFNDKKALDAIHAGDFDFIILDPALLPYFLIPYKLGKPYAYLTAECLGPVRRIPIMPSHIPSPLVSFSDKMDFRERTINFLLYSVLAFLDFGGLEESRNFVPEREDVSYNDLILNASLCLQLRENVIDFIRPEMPDVIPVANMMARKAKPLPAELQSYMNNSVKGVILVSFGTVVTELPLDVLQKLFQAFGTSGYDVIFKYPNPKDLLDVPSNVKVMSWVPQNDLLGHPKMKLFITHCGLNSIIETFYHGVPVIGFPHAIDQFNNAALAKSKGIGEVMALHDFTSDQLKKSINDVISGPTYSSASKKRSMIYKDILEHAPRDPVYWIEHVIKFGDRHLRSHATEMPMYQYLMIDVIAFLILTAVVFITAVFYTCRCVIISTCCRKQKAKVE